MSRISYYQHGKQYKVTISDPETGDTVDEFESYFYGIETDATDYWHRWSVLDPEERTSKRKRLRASNTPFGYQPTGQPIDISNTKPPQTPSPASKPKN